jgi:1-acyl-sn-glycerol-3-phosphate acyltransferase
MQNAAGEAILSGMEQSGAAVRRRKRRDARRERRRIHASRHFNTFLRATVGPYLRWLFRINTRNTELFDTLEGPFVLLGNHACMLDPFIVNAWVPAPIHYVVSDSNFRSRLVDFGLSLVGSIPKTKALSDLETVKNIVKIKMKNGIIGIFPEGQSTWDGHALPKVYSTAKLLKSLKVPVVVAKITGAYFSFPRWARHVRRGRVDLHYFRAFSVAELRASTVDQIYERISELLDHDEFEAQRRRMIPFHGRRPAEYVERVIFDCPECKSINRLRSEDDLLRCDQCGYTVRYGRYGFFEPVSGPLHFDTIRAWNLWQLENLSSRLTSMADRGNREAIFAEPEAVVQIGYKSSPLKPFDTGSLTCYIDRIVLSGAQESTFDIARIEGMNVQNMEHLEFYYDGDLYRVTLPTPRGNTYKWNAAVHHIKESLLPNAVEA